MTVFGSHSVVPMSFGWFLVTALFAVLPLQAFAAEKSVVAAVLTNPIHNEQVDARIIELQVLLDRANISPGEIDGKYKPGLDMMLSAYADKSGLSTTPWLLEFWLKLSLSSAEPYLAEYTVRNEDVEGPFIALPPRLEDMQHLKTASYTTILEALAEKFHMSESLLNHLNPSASFQAGEKIWVANVSTKIKRQMASRVDVDVEQKTVRAYSVNGDLIAYFPASVGNDEKPSPSGTLKVTAIVSQPDFHYNPRYRFKEISTNKPFQIKAGPNNPLGATWIALSKPSYGIHGTPDPSGIGRDSSHGCVRLTNWDAKRLAQMLMKGTPVRFLGNGKKFDPPQMIAAQ